MEITEYSILPKVTVPKLVKVAARSGAMITAGLMIYFFAMKLAGFLEVVELRYLNFFILFLGLFYTLNDFKSTNKKINYLEGLALGFLTSMCTAVFFGLFLYLYLSVIDPAFMDHIIANEPGGAYLSPQTAAGVIIVEAVSSGAVVTFVLMQYFKKEKTYR